MTTPLLWEITAGELIEDRIRAAARRRTRRYVPAGEDHT